MALAELLSAQSVFPEKGRRQAFGKLSLLRGASVPLAKRLLCLRIPRICEGVPPCCPPELDVLAECPWFSSFFFVDCYSMML